MLALVTAGAALRAPTAASQPAATALGRRAALLTSGLAIMPRPSLAAEGAWADHSGPFDEQFFKDFKTNPQGFAYKFVQDGAGDRPEPFQKVFIHYTGYLL